MHTSPYTFDGTAYLLGASEIACTRLMLRGGAPKGTTPSANGKGSDTKGKETKEQRRTFRGKGQRDGRAAKGEGGEDTHPNVMADSKRLESPKSMTWMAHLRLARHCKGQKG